MDRRQRVLSAGFLAFAFGLLLVGGASAQTTLGRLAGTVFDSSGSVLPGATVVLTSQATNQSQTTTTNAEGAYLFPGVPAGSYKVTVELSGFKSATFNDVAISVARETSLTAKLEIGQLTETVTVEAVSTLIQTTTPEVTKTVEQKQLLALPLPGRDMTVLIRTQPGVPGTSTRMNTSINGGRATWTQVTQDGINIQDNFIRTNSLDFLPNRPTSDNVAEFTITSSVAGADTAGGATTVRMVTPSGTNRFRGSAFEANRDSRFSANSFFNNKSAVAKPQLKRNQFGGSVGGPILKNKLFFFAYYEGFRQKSQTAQNPTIPANDDLLTGVFRYVDTSSGTMRSVNVLQLSGLSLDPSVQKNTLSLVPKASNVNNYDVGNSTAGKVLNTAGFRFNQTDLQNRDYVGGRVDYELNQSHHFEVVGSYMLETDDRPDLDTVNLPRPLVFTWAGTKRFVGAWRWLITPRLQNEVRGGFNLAPVKFESDVVFGDTLYNTNLVSNPVATFQPQGRYTNTYQFSDSGSFLWGSHAIQFGGSLQRIHVNSYNYAGRFPTVSFGFSSAAPPSVQLPANAFPGGISSADRNSANSLLSMLSGTITSVARTFQVEDQTSGYVPGIPNNRNYTLNNVAAYVQDSWRWKPNFTIRAGLKWEYYSPVSEDNNLAFAPILNGANYKNVLLDPNATVGFVNGGIYTSDLNNFGPTVGFAWDVFKDGKTSVRGGYSLTFANEEGVTVFTNSVGTNTGLSTGVSLSNQYANVSAGVPVIPTPAFKTVRTMPDQLATSLTAGIGTIDPNIKQPMIHQVSVGISRLLPWAFAAEARYVGTFGRDIWKGIDLNQIVVPSAFQADFLRARSNGFLALAAGKGFDPSYNPTIPGSQVLTVLTKYGLLNTATPQTLIQQNEVAGLADYYVTSNVSGARADFYPNPGIYSSIAMLNDGWSNYDALQVELRRQYRNGLMGNVNYTLSRMRANSTGGTSQSRVEPYLDNARPQLDAGRSPSTINHIINATFIAELPFGQGKKWLNTGGLTNALAGGWQVSAIIRFQSGSPVGITSGRGTFNRSGRSGSNQAVSTLTADQISGLFKITKLPDGRIFWIDPKVVDPNTGRAVGPDTIDNSASFAGQVFFNPVAGAVGTLPIYNWDAPLVYNMDGAIAKRIKIYRRSTLEIRGEFLNALNNVAFYAGDYGVNGTQFGRITGTAFGPRVVQLSARFEF
jgi:hypothetical protein